MHMTFRRLSNRKTLPGTACRGNRSQSEAAFTFSSWPLHSNPFLTLNLVCVDNQIVGVIECARAPEEKFSQNLMKRRTVGDEPLQGFRERQQIPRYLATARLELQFTPSGSPEVVKGTLQHSPTNRFIDRVVP